MEVSLDTLFVGTHGYAMGLDSITLKTKWQTSLPGAGYEVTSVIAGGNNVAYAACYGRVFRLSESKGQVLNKGKLDGCSGDEVRMVLSRDGATIYAGSYGHGAALRSADLKIVYNLSLPGSGYSVTDVIETGQVACFGNNGHVFQVNNTGVIIGRNSLESLGLGRHEVRFAIIADGVEQLFVGTNGSTLALAI